MATSPSVTSSFRWVGAAGLSDWWEVGGKKMGEIEMGKGWVCVHICIIELLRTVRSDDTCRKYVKLFWIRSF